MIIKTDRSFNEMARNTIDSFRSSAPHWVAYEVYRHKGNSCRKSSNSPGVLVVVSDTKMHPEKDVTFQITPVDINRVNIVVEFDNINTDLDVVSAVNYIINY